MTTTTDWIERLREQCEALTQARVVDELRAASGTRFPSPTIISQVLAGVYPSDPARLRALVCGLYCGERVECPVLGEIGRDLCEYHQGQPFSTANPVRVALYRACRAGCPLSRLDRQETQHAER